MRLTCRVWCISMIWRMHGSGCANNVCATCNRRVQGKRVWARARSRVYKSGNSRRSIRGVQRDLVTANGVVCTHAGGSRSSLTYQLRAAWAGLDGLRQEGFQASCYDPDASWTLRSCYQVCLKCWKGHLVCWGSAGTFAWRILEGPTDEVTKWWQISDLEPSKWFSRINQLLWGA